MRWRGLDQQINIAALTLFIQPGAVKPDAGIGPHHFVTGGKDDVNLLRG
jgi:hypothetical protein